jgi:hypothetical protein
MSIAIEPEALSLFLFFISIGIGAGLYETRVVYPNWAVDALPTTLGSKLVSSGQAGAARRFWPFVSPIAMLLAVVNIYFAWHQAGAVRLLWLISSLTIVVKSLATYAYFAPVMMRHIERSEEMDLGTLRRMIAMWTMLSPMRIIAEVIAWISGIGTLILISK